MKALEYALIYLVPVSVIIGLMSGNLFIFLTPLLVFGLVPLLDLAFAKDIDNPTADQAQALSGNLIYRLVFWGCVPLQVVMVVWGASVATEWSLSVEELIGFTLSMGISSAVMGLTVAHELAHREKGSLEYLLSKIVLATVLYAHWGMDHVIGHHQDLGTPKDPSTAKMGESLYHFLPRSISGGFNRIWSIEAARQEQKRRPVWNLNNPMVTVLLGQVVLLIGIALAFGAPGFFYFVFQAMIAVCLLETVNYIGHYGLAREIASDGRYEDVAFHHSWNAGGRLTSRFLFNLGRHSDHYAHPGRHYQLLHHHAHSPQLPAGYPAMVLLALVPPLWRSTMDNRASNSSIQRLLARPED
ncbi:AlkB: alkane 1-monooxygenase [Desulfosarcina variabilis str. Montpellier]|uniref:alkane 1-monooxygenase n=1 Tax=Desulfosarcina variabilis TaxID=2300 RepID=UPI003AFAB51E